MSAPSEEEREREKADRARYNAIEHLVTKRTKNLEYIQKVLTGNVHWLNVVHLTVSDIDTHLQRKSGLRKRVEGWFSLGFSLAPLLNYPNGAQYVRALAQLVEEFEFRSGSIPGQAMRILKAKTAAQPQFHADDDPVRPAIVKTSGKKPVFEFLQTPNIPSLLDYKEVLFALCKILTDSYKKLLDDSSRSPTLSEAILKLDARFKHHVIGFLSREFNALALDKLKAEISSLDHLFGSIAQDDADVDDND